jgi:hypothetical protein
MMKIPLEILEYTLRMFWGEQQAIAAIVAVACNFFVPRVMWT